MDKNVKAEGEENSRNKGNHPMVQVGWYAVHPWKTLMDPSVPSPAFKKKVVVKKSGNRTNDLS